MSHPAAPTPLHALTLETLCDELVSGRAVSLGAEGTFALESREARAVLDWYRRNVGKWSKKVYAEDVEAIVDGLSEEPPALPAAAGAAGPGRRRTLYLKSVRAHRFAGIHRYGEPDRPPAEFVFEVRRPVTLIEGANGAGKSSLLNAIMWCLTGYVSRSQRPPEPANRPVEITLGGAGAGETPSTRVMSPVTPLPSAEALGRLGDEPLALDTWVELAFVDERGDDAGSVRRAVRRGARDSVAVTTPDFSDLGLDPVMREVGTRMPGLIPYIELGTSSDLGKAVAELIGLKPLEDLAQHATKARAKLTKDLVKEREGQIREHDAAFQKVAHELAGLIADHPAIAPAADLPSPDDDAAEEVLAALAGHFEGLQARTLGGARQVLGDAFDDRDRAARDELMRGVGPALGQLEPGPLARLPSAERLDSLGSLPEPELAAAEALVGRIRAEAREVAGLHSRPDLATRLRLYARVARWIKEHFEPHPPIRDCPLCQGDLAGKVDGTTGTAVTAHLGEFLAVETDFLERTTASWEEASRVKLLDALPETLRREATRDLPAGPAHLLEAALGHELFDSQCFRGCLAALKAPTLGLCEGLATSLPPFAEPAIARLPSCFGEGAGTLAEAIRRVLRAVAFARWRSRHDGPCRDALATIIGRIPAGDAAGATAATGAGRVEALPLADRLLILESLVKNVSPLGQALAKVGAMTDALARRIEQRGRIARYARTAEALLELLRLPSLVGGQIAFLTRTLGEATARWKASLYRPAFVGAPGASSPRIQADGTVSVSAESGGVHAPAQHVGNAAELRATLFAFLLAFWEHLLETRGGLALLLLDDPQELFDHDNQRRIANSMPAIARGKNQLIATTFDHRFGRHVAAAVVREKGHGSLEHLRIHPPKASRPHIALGPFAETIEKKRKDFDEAENDAQVARDFLNEVRIYLELRLFDLFDTPEPGLPRQATLADLVTAIRTRNQAGSEPFAGRVFQSLATDPALAPGSPVMTLLNECHHKNVDQITYHDVLALRDDLLRVFGLVQSAHEDYERWLRRDAREAAPARPDAPAVLAFPAFDVPLFEDLAAFSSESAPGDVLESEERLSEAVLANRAVYVVNSHNLGLAGPKNCRVVVDLSDEPVADNRLVIALHQGKVYARRLVRGPAGAGLVVLVSEAIDPTKRPPSLLLPAEEVRLMRIAGILFDDRPHYPRTGEEAAPTGDVSGLRGVQVAFRVRGESALPLARTGQTVLAGAAAPPDRIEAMKGKLVALSTSDGAAFKRVGDAVPGAGHVRSFEAIGGLGSSFLVRAEEVDGDPFSGLPRLENLRPVLGVLYD